MIEDLRHDIMKTSQIMIATAVLLAAVFAGIVLTDEESDAASITVTYNLGDGMTVPVATADDGSLVLYTAEDLANIYTPEEGKELVGWGTEEGGLGTQYTLGAKVIFSDSKPVTLYPRLVDIPEVVTFNIGDDELVSDISGGTTTITSDISDAVKAYETENSCKFIGWLYNGELKDDELNAYYSDADVAEKAVQLGDEFTAVFQATFEVSWNVNDVIYKGTTTGDTKQPENDPTMPNHAFRGWAVEGTKTIVIEPRETLAESGYEVAADTVFVAIFEPDTLTLPLMVDGEAYGTAKVAYGDILIEPTLPTGYGAWGVEVTAEDGTITVKEYDFSKPVTEVVTLVAIPVEDVPDESIYATFNIEGTIYGPYKVTDRFSIPQTDREGYEFLGWTVQGGDGTKLTSAQVQNYQYTEDVTFVAVYEVVEPPAPEEPGFFETSTGKTAAVLIAFVIVLLIAAIYLNLWDLRTKLFGWKIERKGKE